VRQVIQNFWNSWQELSKAPENLTARAVVRESALALTDAFNHTAKQLSDLSADLTENIGVRVNDINSASQQITNLNQQIYKLEGLGNDANDLRDQRDLLIDDLSKAINVSIVEGDNGYTVSMGSVQLVNGFTAGAPVTIESLQASYAAGDLNSGEVAGMLISRDQFVASYRSQLDTMARAVAEGEVTVTLPAGSVIPEGTVIGTTTYTGSITARTLTAPTDVVVQGINGLHHLGYVVGEGGGFEVGGDIFVTSDGSSTFTAGNFSLSPSIVSNVMNISSSMRTYLDPADNIEKVVQGNNSMALLIAGLKSTTYNFDPDNTGQVILSSGTLDEFLRSIVVQLGVQTQEAVRQGANQKILVEQIESRRQSVSGVSLDEEMANMIKFQHAYNAAARSLTTFDEMLDRVINGMGIVGR
ncbi:MAG TPA: flagellar basal body rod C-terminal domain-containing protein, partial [Bacilli bacterium]